MDFIDGSCLFTLSCRTRSREPSFDLYKSKNAQSQKLRPHNHDNKDKNKRDNSPRTKRGKTDPGLQVSWRQPYRLPSSQTCLSGLVGGEVVQGFRHIVLAFEITIRILVSCVYLDMLSFFFRGARSFSFRIIAFHNHLRPWPNFRRPRKLEPELLTTIFGQPWSAMMSEIIGRLFAVV